MSRHSQRRSPAPVLWTLIAVLGLPALAQAQLFPNAAIHRKRIPCPQEAPVYKMYREQFYGHYPTCWRRWPSGWGCPTPEAPPPWDFVQREEPVRTERDIQVPNLDTSLPAAGGLPANDLPLPDQGSPFEMPGGANQPSQDPFEMNAPPAQPQPGTSPFDFNPQSSLPVPGSIDTSSLQPQLPAHDIANYGDGAGYDGTDVPVELSTQPFDPVTPAMPGSIGPVSDESFGPPPTYVEDYQPTQPMLVDAPPHPQHAPRRGVVAGMVDRLKTRFR